MLEVRSLSRRFGGLMANDDVSLSVRTGEIHVVIGRRRARRGLGRHHS